MVKIKPITYSRFKGIDNISSTNRIEARHRASDGRYYTYLPDATNCDIDAQYAIKRRAGYSTAVLSGNFKSIWSDGKNIYAVRSGDLVRIVPGSTYSYETLLPGIGHRNCAFVAIGLNVYFTNELVIGSIKSGVASLLSEVTETYKKTMPAGHIMEHYKGKLYVAQGRMVFDSDSMVYERLDTRKAFMQFPGRITMIQAVTDGLYLSYEGKTLFLRGNNKADFLHEQVALQHAIEGTAQKGRNLVHEGRTFDSYVIWLSEDGICIGGEGGQFLNATQDKYGLPGVINGASIIKSGAPEQYISVINS